MSKADVNPPNGGDMVIVKTSAPVEPEHYPAFEDSEITVLKGRTMSKNAGWWSAILLVRTYGKTQVKWYLWQERVDKATGQTTWKRKQSWTVNSYNWEDQKKVTDEFMVERKAIKI